MNCWWKTSIQTEIDSWVRKQALDTEVDCGIEYWPIDRS